MDKQYKLLPMMPTENMVFAVSGLIQSELSCQPAYAQLVARNICKLMFEAAPTHPSPGEIRNALVMEVIEWLETEVSAIDLWYRGDPSYEHDAGYMRDRVMRLLDQAKVAFKEVQPSPAEPLDREAIRNATIKDVVSKIRAKMDKIELDEVPIDQVYGLLNSFYPLKPQPSQPMDQDAIRNAALEEAERACRQEALGDHTEHLCDIAYNNAIIHATQAIRSLKSQPAQLSGNSGELPNDKDLLEFGSNEQFFLFCSEDEFLDIAKSVLRRFGQAKPSDSQAEPSDTEKDAARYRWLRDESISKYFGDGVNAPVVFNVDDAFMHDADDHLEGEDLDNAVDAAMRAQKENK